MNTIILALALMFATFTPVPVAEAPVPVASVQAVEPAQTVQTEREKALEASAWESLDMLESIDIIKDDSIVTYSRTITVEDGDYTLAMDEFAVEDPYDNVYVHIFKVLPLYHA